MIPARRLASGSPVSLPQAQPYRHQRPGRQHGHPLDYPCLICMAVALRPCRNPDGTPMSGYHPTREKAAR